MSRIVILLAAVILAGSIAAGQSKSYTPPRTSDGQPDLQGVWTNITIPPLERPANLAGKVTVDEDKREYRPQLVLGDEAQVLKAATLVRAPTTTYRPAW